METTGEMLATRVGAALVSVLIVFTMLSAIIA